MIGILNYFIRRPVTAIVLHVAILLIGIRAIFALPIVQYPLFESSTLIITTHYVGASAETVRGFITTPIERAVSTTSGLDYVESKSVAGTSIVTARLDLGVDGNRALTEVSNRIDQIRSEFPPEAEPPKVEVQRGDRPWATFYLAFTSDTLTLAELSEYVSRDVQSALVGIPGVQRVTPLGDAPRAMRIWLDAARMAAFGIDASDVSDALQRNNYVSAVGQAKSDSITVNLRTDTNLSSEADFRNLIVRQSSEGVVRLDDFARVQMGVEETQADTRVDRKPSIYLEVWPLAGVSELQVDTELRERLDEIRPTLPPGVDAMVAYNATTYMRDSLVEITKTLAETILIVALVVILFLGSVRYAVVPLVAVPISLVGTAALMALMGMSLNTLTLLAIVLSIGLVVDDAIVVVESVQRYIREGKSKVEAALLSVKQLAAPLFAMTITLAVVYAPIGFLPGLSGVMLREFAFTLACAVLVSGLVALTLSPVMSGWAGTGQKRENRFSRAIVAAMERIAADYHRALEGALAARAPILTVALFLALLIPVLFANSARELAPLEDQSEIDFVGSGSAASTIEYMGEGHIDTVVDKLEHLPGGDYVWYIALPQQTIAALMLTPWNERDVSPQELIGPTYTAIAEIPGMQLFPLLPPSLPSGGFFDVEFVVVANASHAELEEQAGKLMAAAMKTGKFMYVDTDLKIDMPVSRIEIDREKVAQLGLDLAAVGRALGIMVGGDYVNRFDYEGRPYKVIPQVEQSARISNEDLLNLRIRTPSGASIPLSSVASIVDGVEPRSLNRFQNTDSFRITGGIAPGETKNSALTALEEVAAEVLPPDYRIDFAGESRQIRQQGNDLVWMGALGLILIYLVLLLKFGNFRDPLVVLLGSVPLGLSGALMFSFFDVTTINLYSQVGLITMIGLIAKNGILIVEFANRQRDNGMSRIAAVHEAAVSRLRPVLMTAFATIAGHLPLVFVSGPGSGARNSIGLMLVSGMAIGTVFTLFVLPCVYSVLANRPVPPDAQGATPSLEPPGQTGSGPAPALAISDG